MSDSPTTEFEEVREQAIEALEREDLRSIYVGILDESEENEFFFGNETEDPHALQRTAATQLGMLCRVLADQSDLTVEQVANLAAERANELGVQR
ncbi:hypothetical protein J2752_000312 [Halarchaeum rubridurum]|uniref:DUF8113 domain-containing protein n=1 Tax=Halarchaeum rubridurum TaxID=489911 RepID=A0A830FRR7_9EURY|nr:hypothetical protein [Halarchaeum rubridurum]MBP1953431.1 hypothetical protein [Halarchaeum rubridurum]GGM65324.1 hypothetical protein GCM10009017_14270 [Halarchaeum rubridurum]